MAKADAEAERLVKEGEDRAREEAKALLDKAQAEAAEARRRGEEAAEREREKARQELAGDIAALAAEVAGQPRGPRRRGRGRARRRAPRARAGGRAVPDRRRAWARALFLAAPRPREPRRLSPTPSRACACAVERDARDPQLPRRPLGRPRPQGRGHRGLAGRRRCGAPAAGTAVFERFCALIVDKGRASLLPADRALLRRDARRRRRHRPARGRGRARDGRARPCSASPRPGPSIPGLKTTRATVRVNPALIAGYRLRAGSLRIDYSIAGRLERLRRELARPLGKSQACRAAAGARRRMTYAATTR